jgi:hypothetical protein
MFFGAGNCLDNNSDGFHFIGYPETVAEVESPSDLQNWTVIYPFDNPILSTDTVTNPMTGTKYPANPPLTGNARLLDMGKANSRETLTRRWREPDSNHRSRSGERSLGCCRREMPDR